eukprot:GILK01005736.1.p1 GENE.GILK01005736.1~~GILK01005736.1.p1  ORF type:complete len:279 (+),score=60.71 GILK01005736.1:47-838(+)
MVTGCMIIPTTVETTSNNAADVVDSFVSALGLPDDKDVQVFRLTPLNRDESFPENVAIGVSVHNSAMTLESVEAALHSKTVLMQQMEEAQSQLHTYQMSVSEAHQKLRERDRELEELRSQIQQLTNRNGTLQQDNDKLRGQLASSETLRRETEEKVQLVKHEFDTLVKDLIHFQRTGNTTVLRSVGNVLRRAEEDRLPTHAAVVTSSNGPTATANTEDLTSVVPVGSESSSLPATSNSTAPAPVASKKPAIPKLSFGKMGASS